MRSDWAAYIAPMLAFMGALTLQEYLPAGSEPLGMALRVLLPAATFLYFWSRGAFPELKGFRPGAGAAADVAVGLGVAALWAGPYLAFESLRPNEAAAFDPGAAGESWRGALWALRFAGFVLVTPFIEELLVRSFLIRVVDVYDSDRDFREIPVGTFAWRSFLVTVAWFTFTHAQWEWLVALPTGVVYNLWLYRRKHIGSLILTHAVTNAALLFFALGDEGRLFFL